MAIRIPPLNVFRYQSANSCNVQERLREIEKVARNFETIAHNDTSRYYLVFLSDAAGTSISEK
jgi:hypothetical protein